MIMSCFVLFHINWLDFGVSCAIYPRCFCMLHNRSDKANVDAQRSSVFEPISLSHCLKCTCSFPNPLFDCFGVGGCGTLGSSHMLLPGILESHSFWFLWSQGPFFQFNLLPFSGGKEHVLRRVAISLQSPFFGPFLNLVYRFLHSSFTISFVVVLLPYHQACFHSISKALVISSIKRTESFVDNALLCGTLLVLLFVYWLILPYTQDFSSSLRYFRIPWITQFGIPFSASLHKSAWSLKSKILKKVTFRIVTGRTKKYVAIQILLVLLKMTLDLVQIVSDGIFYDPHSQKHEYLSSLVCLGKNSLSNLMKKISKHANFRKHLPLGDYHFKKRCIKWRNSLYLCIVTLASERMTNSNRSVIIE